MSLLRPATARLSLAARSPAAAAAAKKPRLLPLTTPTPTGIRGFASTQRRCGANAEKHKHEDGHHDDGPFEPPTGWLWGVRPGEKPKREGWEPFFYYGFILPLVLCGIGYAFKPDDSLDTWALEEARRRLEAEGILPDPLPDHKLPIDGYTSTREGKHPPV